MKNLFDNLKQKMSDIKHDVDLIREQSVSTLEDIGSAHAGEARQNVKEATTSWGEERVSMSNAYMTFIEESNIRVRTPVYAGRVETGRLLDAIGHTHPELSVVGDSTALDMSKNSYATYVGYYPQPLVSGNMPVPKYFYAQEFGTTTAAPWHGVGRPPSVVPPGNFFEDVDTARLEKAFYNTINTRILTQFRFLR